MPTHHPSPPAHGASHESSGGGTTVSVAMATYNGAVFIDAQLQSLLAQSRLPDELVVVDDGSTDETLGRVAAFAAAAAFPVRIVRNETRLGWRGNFIKAADLCRSGLIAFCDQDDVWYPRKLERMVPLFADPRVLLAFHDADLVDAAGQVTGTLRGNETEQALLSPRARPTTWSNPFGLTLVFRRCLTGFGPYWPRSVDPRDVSVPAAHDQWYYYLASNLGCVAFMPERLLGYRQHGGNTVGFRTPRRMRRPYRPAERAATASSYLAMLEAFCRVLRQAQADGLGTEFSELAAALDANERLLDRIRRDHAAHHDRSFGRRLGHFGLLLRTRAYSRGTPWNLGYRALLDAALVGVPFGR